MVLGWLGSRIKWLICVAVVVNLTGCCGVCGKDDSERSTAKGPPAEPLRPVDRAFINNHIARLQQGAECPAPSSAYNVWCKAAAGFATGAAAPIPSGETVLIGLSTFVNTKGDPKADIGKFSTVSTLAFNNSGKPRGMLTGISSKNPSEKAQIDLVFRSVVQVLKGKSQQVMMDQKLANFVKSRPTAETYVMKQTTRGWQMLGGSHAFVRKVGDIWVAVEIPRSHDGMYVSMYRKANISVRPGL